MDEKLINAIKEMADGKESGFNVVYSETYNHVYFRAKQHMHDEEDALDLTQIVFVEAFKNIGSLQTPEALYGWLDRITYNQGMKLYRKQKEVLLTEEGEGILDILESNDIESMPELSLEQKETSKIIREIIEELPEAQKVALIAYYFDHFTVGQIAEMEECSEGTIKSRLNYARKYIKDRIEEKEKKEGYRLHVFALPTLLWAIKFMAEDTKMSAKTAQMTYDGACSEVGIQAGTITTNNVTVSEMASSTKMAKPGMATNSAKITAGIGAKIAAFSGGTKALIIAGALVITGAGIGGAIYSVNIVDSEVVDEVQEIGYNSSETIIEADLSPYITVSDYIEYYDADGEMYMKSTKRVHPQKQDGNTYVVTKEMLANLVNDGDMIYLTWNIPEGIIVTKLLVPCMFDSTNVSMTDYALTISTADESTTGICPNVTVKEDITIEFALEDGINESEIDYEKALSEMEEANSNNIEEIKIDFNTAEMNQIGIAIIYAKNQDFLNRKDEYVFNTRMYIDSVLNGRDYEEGSLPLGWKSDVVSAEAVKTFWKDGFGIDIPSDYSYFDTTIWGNVSCESERSWDMSLERLNVTEMDVEDNLDGTYTISGVVAYEDMYEGGAVEESFTAICGLSGNQEVFCGYRIIDFSNNASAEIDFDDIARKYAHMAESADPDDIVMARDYGFNKFYIDDINSDGIPEFFMPTPYADEATKEYLIFSYKDGEIYQYGAIQGGHVHKLYGFYDSDNLIFEWIQSGYNGACIASPNSGTVTDIYEYQYMEIDDIVPTFKGTDGAYEMQPFSDLSVDGIRNELERYK